MQKILIVEDSRFFLTLINNEIKKRLPWGLIHAESLSQTQLILDKNEGDIALMVLDLGLPGSTRDEALEFAKKVNVPVVVYTGTFSNELGVLLRAYNIVDYVIKDNPGSLKYLVDIIYRILSNRDERVLVVDDSVTSRNLISKLLQHYQLQTLEAEDGVQALKILRENDDIRLVITDYYMPNMNGFELASKIRQFKSLHQVAIIGVSSFNEPSISTRFLKSGANDFINKPFAAEEFFCRISQNMSQLDMFNKLETAANTDPLTQLHNRRYFYHTVRKLQTEKDEESMHAMALIDIDYFKKVNDTYGHNAGDEALKKVAALIRQELNSDKINKDTVLARFGGEEFCVYFPTTTEENCLATLEHIRETIENMEIEFDDKKLQLTISTGTCINNSNNIETMTNVADHYLYKAKTNGRNRTEKGDNEAIPF